MKKSAHEREFGLEPQWNQKLMDDDIAYQKELHKGLAWYHAAYDDKTKRTWFYEWVKEKSLQVPKIGLSEDYEFSTVGALARMYQRGFPISVKHFNHMTDKLNKLNSKTQKNQKNTGPVKRRVFSNTEILIKNLLTHFDGFVDSVITGKTFKAPTKSPVTIKKSIADNLIDYYSSELEELKKYTAEDGLDFSNKTKKDLIKTYNKIIFEIKAAVVVKARKTRKIKVKTVKNKLKPCMLFDTFVGLNPEQVQDAKTIIAYNTKKRILFCFVAGVSDDLQPKGMSIINYDPEKSYGKTIRKPDEMLKRLVGMPPMRFKRSFEAIKASKKPVNIRINEDVIILKVMRT